MSWIVLDPSRKASKASIQNCFSPSINIKLLFVSGYYVQSGIGSREFARTPCKTIWGEREKGKPNKKGPVFF